MAVWAYWFFLTAGLALAVISALLGEVFGHLGGHDLHVGGHDLGGGHDIHVGGHEIHVGGHEVHVGHGAGHDVGHDVGGGHDVGHPDVATNLSPLSMPVLSTCMVFFGGTGLFLQRTLPVPVPSIIAVPIAGASGFVFATLAFLAINAFMKRAQGTSHISASQLAGVEAEVITPIPAEGLGEIAYSTPTGRASCPARSEEGVLIPKNSMVSIVRVVGNTAVVRELMDERLRRLRVEPAEAPGPEN